MLTSKIDAILGIEAVPPREEADMTIFAEDDASHIGADRATGHVVAARKGDPAARTFVNSSTSAFAECLSAFADYAAKVTSLDDGEAEALVAQTKRALLAIDPDALGSRETWWSMIVEQMEQGQL